MIYHYGQFPMRKTLQINGVPVGLLYRGTVVAPDNDAGIGRAEGFSGKSSAFQSDFVRVQLGKNLSPNFKADGDLPKGQVPVSAWLSYISRQTGL